MKDPILRAHLGPDWMRRLGWAGWLTILPMRSLMRRDEQGMLILSALDIEFHLFPFWVRVRSDANEIATRRAALAGWA